MSWCAPLDVLFPTRSSKLTQICCITMLILNSFCSLRDVRQYTRAISQEDRPNSSLLKSRKENRSFQNVLIVPRGSKLPYLSFQNSCKFFHIHLHSISDLQDNQNRNCIRCHSCQQILLEVQDIFHFFL